MAHTEDISQAYTTVTALSTGDFEMDALALCMGALSAIGPVAQARVLTYLTSRYTAPPEAPVS